MHSPAENWQSSSAGYGTSCAISQMQSTLFAIFANERLGKECMLNNLFISALLISGSVSTFADPEETTDKVTDSTEDNRGKMLAITPRGAHAMDTARMLAIQTSLHPYYKPELMALDKHELSLTAERYKLSTHDLPAFIFLNSQGAELGRITAGAMGTVGRCVTDSLATLD